MARVTIEDCLRYIPNRFDLTLVAAKRAKELSMGKEAMVPWNNDKPTLVALREIAAGYLDAITAASKKEDTSSTTFDFEKAAEEMSKIEERDE